MEASLWNIGMKVDDIDSEIAFWQEIGAKLVLRETFTAPDGEKVDYAFVEFGGTRIFLTPKTVFEDKLGHELTPGLTHAVFEVEVRGFGGQGIDAHHASEQRCCRAIEGRASG